MDSFRHYRFSVIRYVPDVLREEFINIGVIVSDISDARSTTVRVTRDWNRVVSLDQNADLETLKALEADVNLQLVENVGDHSILKDWEESFSNNLQLSPVKGRAAASMDILIEELMSHYVEPPVRSALYAVV